MGLVPRESTPRAKTNESVKDGSVTVEVNGTEFGW